MLTSEHVGNWDFRPRKLATVKVTPEAVLSLLTLDGTRLLSMKGVPEDAVMVGMAICPKYGSLVLTLESESFAPLEEGELPPQIALECQAKDLGKILAFSDN